jgi:tetratricopeptide (TPR) repeat protein
MVMVEALTGARPEVPGDGTRTARQIARTLASSRREQSAALGETAKGKIPAGLRPILEASLAPLPAGRYRRASELADDLDQWRLDRPLAHAADPPWPYPLRRWAKRQRIALTAASLCAVIGVSSAIIIWNTSQRSLREQARTKLAQLWDGADPAIYRYRTARQWNVANQAEIIEASQRNLNLFGVLNEADWRKRDDVYPLPAADRSELECWLMEQGLRLAQALADRPASPGDWRRAINVLDKVEGDEVVSPIDAVRQQILEKLQLPPARRSALGGSDTVPNWIVEYLRGVASEQLHSRDTLGHFERVLKERPELFWAHYRAASAAYRLALYEVAADHLQHCIRRRPSNPVLHTQLAACLFEANRIPDALEECTAALRLDPDQTEAYRTRTFIWGRLGQDQKQREDLDRYGLLTRGQGKSAISKLRFDARFYRTSESNARDVGEAARQILQIAPEDSNLRDNFGLQLAIQGREEEALDELGKVLEANPDHLPARFHRALVCLRLGRDSAYVDLMFLLENPRFEELIREDPSAIRVFHYLANDDIAKKRFAHAIELTERSLGFAEQQRSMLGEAHYATARAYAAGAGAHPEFIREAARHLNAADAVNQTFLDAWFEQDDAFRDTRERLQPLLVRNRGPGH